MKKKVLIIDDEELIRLSLSEGLKDFNYFVDTAYDSHTAYHKVEIFRPDIILLDMKLKSENGLVIAEQIKTMDDSIEIIIMTAFSDIKTAIKAIKSGAIDYLKKPLDLEEVNVSISKALKNQSIKRKLEIYKQRENESAQTFIGSSEAMEGAIRKMNILADNDSVTVLIRGETGTGKEVVASYIHQNSIRKDGLMLSLNCAAIPAQLLESELFGFEKNAFSGAGARKRGLIELADGGTLFLDELGEIPLDIQAKLLRFLETKKFKRIGGLDSIEVDIRVIAATNKNLEEAIKNKEFREDLYYRLNVVPIQLPALRERGQDIISLSNHFLSVFMSKFGKDDMRFSKAALDRILAYNWPGNVRELKNIIERMVILTDVEIIGVEHLPLELQSPDSVIHADGKSFNQPVVKELCLDKAFSLEEVLAGIEINYINKALQQANNNHSQAAKLLGISRYALKRRMEKYLKEL